jgi:Sulfotransferase family
VPAGAAGRQFLPADRDRRRGRNAQPPPPSPSSSCPKIRRAFRPPTPPRPPPSPSSSSSSSQQRRSAAYFFAVYLYVAALCLYFSMGFALLNRLAAAVEREQRVGGGTGTTGGGGGGGGGGQPLRLLPHDVVVAEPSSDGSNGEAFRVAGTANKMEVELGEEDDADASVLPSRAVPLVVRRDAHGAWHPNFRLLNASMTTIRRHFFFDDHPPPEDGASRETSIAIPDHRKRDVLGVVRITKTGSTSLLSFLLASKAALTYDYALKVDRAVTSPEAGDRAVPYCFYGTNPDPPSVRHPVRGQCGHRTYARMVSVFARQLAQHKENSDGGAGGGADASRPGPSKAHPEPLQLSLSIITMVRDPFDRMLSFFRYFREIYPDWAPMYKAQPQVLQTLQDGNFPAFLRELALLEDHEWTRRYQYEYFGASADEAIEVVREARVLPLLNECFNASALLLAHQYPALFPSDQPDATHAFLASGNSHARKTVADGGPASSMIHPDLRPMQEFDREAVRRQAQQVWLRNEYRFYDEAKTVLGRMLRQAASAPGSIVDPAVVRQCLGVLELSPSPEESPSSRAVAAVA